MTIRVAPCTKNHQSGLTLIEALIASVLLVIMFVGMAQTLTKNLRAQGENYAMGLTLFDIRQQLQQADGGVEGLCNGGSMDSLWLEGNVALTAQCSSGPSVQLALPDIAAGDPVSLRQFSVSTKPTDDSKLLFGGDGVITTSTTL